MVLILWISPLLLVFSWSNMTVHMLQPLQKCLLSSHQPLLETPIQASKPNWNVSQWNFFDFPSQKLAIPSSVLSDHILSHCTASPVMIYRGYNFFKDPTLCVVHHRHSVSICCIYFFSLVVANAANFKWLFLIMIADFKRKNKQGHETNTLWR